MPVTEITTVYVLEQARALIANPDNWLQGEYATDSSGREIDVKSPKACSFCAAGAIAHVLKIDGVAAENTVAAKYLDDAASRLFSIRGIVAVNDEKTHQDVMAAFDSALEAARYEGI